MSEIGINSSNSKVIVNKKQRSLWQEAWRRFLKNKLAVISMIFLLILVFLAFGTLIIDLITDGNFYQKNVINQNLRLRLKPPSGEHLFGLDEFGRDMF